MSVTEWEQKWTARKNHVWKGFLRVSPFIWIMSAKRANGQKIAFAPLIRNIVGFFEHDTLRWKKRNEFSHQPYHVLQSIPDRIRWLRLQKGLTQQEAADLLCVGRSTYIDYETEGELTDYLGNVGHYHELSSVSLENSTYSLSLAKDYYKFLLGIKNRIV